MSLPSSLANMKPETIQRFREIVQVSRKYESPEQEETCRKVVEALSAEDLDTAAKVSYAYWVLATLKDKEITDEVTKRTAMKVAKWHVEYIGQNNVAKATTRLQEAMKFRRDHSLEAIRTCFDADATSDVELSLKKDIRSDMEKQLQFCQGTDKEGRTLLIKMPRAVGGTTEEAYFRQQLYVAERSSAVTEYVSKGQVDTVCACFNMQNQNSSVTPKFAWQLDAIKALQTVFPGRMGKVFVLEAPFMIRQLFNTIKPFLSASIKNNTFLVAGSTKTKLLEQAIEHPNFLTSDGKLVEPVDLQIYLCETPFYEPYNYHG